jgi:hypothetical protein
MGEAMMVVGYAVMAWLGLNLLLLLGLGARMLHEHVTNRPAPRPKATRAPGATASAALD